MENIYKHIATTLKDLCQKKGWSLDKAALATGVSIDKKLAVIEEKLKNATTKSLMAAGATEKQALQFWESTHTFIKPPIPLQPKMKVQKLQ